MLKDLGQLLTWVAKARTCCPKIRDVLHASLSIDVGVDVSIQ